MRGRASVIVGVLSASLVARAETADELQAAGEQAARSGNYMLAIEKFKAADRVETRARHACLIALAYMRRNLWAQAEVFRDRCHERAAKTSEVLPDWVADADQQIHDAIAAANVAEVTIEVEPVADTAATRVTLSSFAPDEQFGPRVIHLPPGIHQIIASAPGKEGRELIDIKDASPQHVVIQLRSTSPPPSRKTPWLVMGGGLALGAVGGVLEATWYANARQAYQDALDASPQNLPAIADARGTWSTRRDVVIGCYVAGGLAVIAGAVLEVFADRAETPAVAVVPRDGGAIVSLGWTR